MKDSFMKELKRGIKVESEHSKTVGNNKIIITRIALDHLEEDPHYYRKLAKVEKKTKLRKVS